jgi:hypothetical protein
VADQLNKTLEGQLRDWPNRPRGSNADEWHLFLCEHLDNRANSPNGLTFMALQIAEAIEAQIRLTQMEHSKPDIIPNHGDNISCQTCGTLGRFDATGEAGGWAFSDSIWRRPDTGEYECHECYLK